MSDIVLRDIDPMLAQRIRDVSQSRGQGMPETLQWLVVQGLHACEQDAAINLDRSESGVLEEAISALEKVPDDCGFALIGRTPAAAKPASDEPDQSVDTGFSVK